MRKNKIKSQNLDASSWFLVKPGSDSGTNSEKEGYSFLHLKCNNLFSNSQYFFSLSEKAKLGYIEMGLILTKEVTESHPHAVFEIKS